jgi:hypothetical protein
MMASIVTPFIKEGSEGCHKYFKPQLKNIKVKIRAFRMSVFEKTLQSSILKVQKSCVTMNGCRKVQKKSLSIIHELKISF